MTRYLYYLLMVILLRSSSNVGLPAHQDITVGRHSVAHVGIHPRSEIDLTTEKQVLFCAGQNKSLECVSPGSTIAIMDTFWGRLTDKICPSEDGDPTTNCASDFSTTSLLKNLCDDKVFCEIPARHTVLQAPGTTHCPGVNKYLIVNYTCMPIERKFVLCDGETTSLQCGEGWKLNILTALWGRMSPATCATTLGRPSRLGKCDSSNKTLEKVQSICQGTNRCVVRADDEHMVQGNEQHCPDVDKYAIVSYRCQPQVQQVAENLLQSSSVSHQGFLPNVPTRQISFTNHNSQSNDYHTNSNTPYLLQATIPNNTLPLHHNQKLTPNLNTESSLDGLLEEYMESQKNVGDDALSGDQLSVPHDGAPPPTKEKLGVPQDSPKENLQQNIALLKKILHSKNLMKVGTHAMAGIDMATAVNQPRNSKEEVKTLSKDSESPKQMDTNSNDNKSLKQMDLNQDELNHLAHSSDAIKIINEYMSKNKARQKERMASTQQAFQNSPQANTSRITSTSLNTTSFSLNDNSLNKGTKGVDNQHSEQMSTTTTTTKPKPSPTIKSTLNTNPTHKDLSKLLDPTAKLGGKVMGNLFYDKFLKPAQQNFENQANDTQQKTEGKAMNILRKKVSALQAISDALTLITSKMDPAQRGGKRHHERGRQGNQHEGNSRLLEVADNVGQNDVQFLQDKINRAIETTEAMERQAALRNPSLVALKLKGKVAKDVQAETRNKVQQSKERDRIDKQIKDIEDSFNLLIEKAEKSGKFSDLTILNKPTSNLFEEIQNGALNLSFNDDKKQGHNADNATKGTYGFEVVSQEPVINIIKEKNGSVNSDTDRDTSKLFSLKNFGPQKVSEQNGGVNKPFENTVSRAVKLAPITASKAANSIANALRRQTSNQSLSFVALQPITTFNSFNDVTLGGRINSEVIKKKENEKIYKGKDVNTLLNMIKSRPTVKNQLPQSSHQASNPIKQAPGIQVHGKNEQVAEVQNVGTLDSNAMNLLGLLVRGFLEQNKNRRVPRKRVKTHRRRKKKNKHTELEQQDFVIGAKHNTVGKSTDSQTIDKDLLTMLEKQLSYAKKYSYKIENLVSDERNEGEENETVKSVPNDKEKVASEEILTIPPTVKPMPAPSDDPSLELVNKYTTETGLNGLLIGLQKMLKQEEKDLENDKKVGISPVQESLTDNASKTSLSSKPHVVKFSGAATSGKILNSLDEGKATYDKNSQAITQFAGGRIFEPASKTGLKPVRQETISIINANPTTKSLLGVTHKNTPTSKLKLKTLVSGVKLLLKALRGKNSESYMVHHEGNLETNGLNSINDDNPDDVKTGEAYDERDNDFNLHKFKKKENGKQKETYNGFFDYIEPKHKVGNWFVGEGNSYITGFNQPKNYQYDEQYDMNLAQQYASNPNQYSTFTPDTYSAPFASFASQQPSSFEYLPKQSFQDPFDKPNKLPNPAKHALNSALKNDPIIQAVEEFSDNENKLYKEKLRGIQKNHIPRKNEN